MRRSKLDVTKVAIISLGVALIILLAIIDDMTGHRMTFSLFYILPIVIVSYLVSRSVGLYMALLSAFAWLAVDIRSEIEYSHYFHLWNVIVRLGFFFFITYGISSLALINRRQQDIADFLAHDLKSPMAAIVAGFYSIKEINSGESKDIQRMSEMGITSSNRLILMINSLNDLAKLENGKLQLNIEEVNIKKLIDTSITMIEMWATAHSVTILQDIATDRETFAADKMLLERVIVNILTNAVKISKAGSEVKIGVYEKNKFLYISISDTGPGISKHMQKKIFDKFQYASFSKNGIAVGTGLGLTFCREAVNELGGEIKIASEPDHGATFVISVPLK